MFADEVRCISLFMPEAAQVLTSRHQSPSIRNQGTEYLYL